MMSVRYPSLSQHSTHNMVTCTPLLWHLLCTPVTPPLLTSSSLLLRTVNQPGNATVTVLCNGVTTAVTATYTTRLPNDRHLQEDEEQSRSNGAW